MKKLYKVEAKIMVMAKNGDEAEFVAIEGIEMSECDLKVQEAINEGYFEGWIFSIPWNSDDNRTCKEILKDEKNNLHQ